jgi:hypothetical protein
VENLFSKATAMKNDEGRSPGIFFDVATPKRDHEIISLSGEQKSLRRSRLGFDRIM